MSENSAAPWQNSANSLSNIVKSFSSSSPFFRKSHSSHPGFRVKNPERYPDEPQRKASLFKAVLSFESFFAVSFEAPSPTRSMAERESPGFGEDKTNERTSSREFLRGPFESEKSSFRALPPSLKPRD